MKLLASNTTKVTEKPLLNLPELSGIFHVNPQLERVLVVGRDKRDYLPGRVATIWLFLRRTLLRSVRYWAIGSSLYDLNLLEFEEFKI